MNPWLLVLFASLLFFAGGVVGMVLMAVLVVSKGDLFDEGYFAGVEDADEVTGDGIPIIRLSLDEWDGLTKDVVGRIVDEDGELIERLRDA